MNHKHLLHKLRPYLRLNNLTLIIAGMVAFSWLLGTVTTLQKNFLLQQQVDDLDQQILIAQIENATLGFQRQYYQSNEYLELQARAKLGKASPGEKVVLLPLTPKSPANSTTPSINTPAVSPSNFQQWMRFLFGRQS